jgi:hypothetical protein
MNFVEIKNVERKNIESILNAASAHANHMQIEDIDPSADYSHGVDKRACWSCINSTSNIFYFRCFLFLPNLYHSKLRMQKYHSVRFLSLIRLRTTQKRNVEIFY